MRIFLVILFFSIWIDSLFCQEIKNDNWRYASDSIDRLYIPKDLNDCIVQINGFWNDSIKNEIRKVEEKKFVGFRHLDFGMWIRNNWQLWQGSRLSLYFNQLGIYHPDDMSGIILTSYYRVLKDKKIRLQEQIDSYKDYYKVNAYPDSATFPSNISKKDIASWILYNRHNNKQGCIQVAKDSSTNETWIYDYYYGWAKINEIDLNRKLNQRIVKRLFNKYKK